jgi:hypothetical protein
LPTNADAYAAGATEAVIVTFTTAFLAAEPDAGVRLSEYGRNSVVVVPCCIRRSPLKKFAPLLADTV